jgi:hypothetical protein
LIIRATVCGGARSVDNSRGPCNGMERCTEFRRHPALRATVSNGARSLDDTLIFVRKCGTVYGD